MLTTPLDTLIVRLATIEATTGKSAKTLVIEDDLYDALVRQLTRQMPEFKVSVDEPMLQIMDCDIVPRSSLIRINQ